MAKEIFKREKGQHHDFSKIGKHNYTQKEADRLCEHLKQIVVFGSSKYPVASFDKYNCPEIMEKEEP